MLVKVVETDGELRGLSAEHFRFGHMPAALVLAFISPNLDFPHICQALREMVGAVPLVAVSTAGEMCASSTDDRRPLYKETVEGWRSVVVQAFAPDLISSVAVHAVSLHNDDIRLEAPSVPRSERVRRIADSMGELNLPFGINCADTLALTFVDGLSACESYLMEAVYRTGRFPCLFIGGSAGGKLDFQHTYLFDGRCVLENHAVVCFLKVAPGKRYGIFKTQNFRKTEKSVVVLDADPDRRIVSTVVDPTTFKVETACAAMCRMLECEPAELPQRLAAHPFAIELDGESFVRSMASVDPERGTASFYCDINTGDRLFLQEATDFVEQTRADYQAFLNSKPAPIAALLNDCILRRLSNQPRLGGLDGLWSCPTAGFSTFGELLGININQTLTAIFFFEVSEGQPFRDVFVDGFPVHYGRFQNYFTSCRLSRLELLNELRSKASGTLIDHFADMESQSEEIAPIAIHARTERALRDSRARLLAMTSSLYEGVLLVDPGGRVLFANRSAARLLEDDDLVERDLDEVMMLQTQNERHSFVSGPLCKALGEREAVVDEDAFLITPAGRRLNIAYAAARLEDGGKVLGVILSFRSIEALKKAQRDALQASRMASVGQLAAGIAHEINTPIQYIGDNLTYIRDSFGEIAAAIAEVKGALAGTEHSDAVERILAEREVDYLLRELPLAANQSLEGVRQVSHIVLSMKTFSHPGTTTMVNVDINQVIDSTLTVSRSEWRNVASVETCFAADLPPVPCYPADINQVLLNLVVNAAQAIGARKSGEPGVIRLSTRRDGDVVEVRVADTGPGVPADIRDRIFDPFFTTKDVGKGTGQGLAICLDVIAHKHDGQLFLEEGSEGGATFIMRLPLKTLPGKPAHAPLDEAASMIDAPTTSPHL